MFESLALALAKAFATYLFKYYVLASPNVKIEGAPSWFYKESAQEICVFPYEKGGYETLESIKGKSVTMMTSKIDGITEIVVYENYRNLKDPKEKEFVKAFMKDSELPVFVRQSMRFRDIIYDKDTYTAFGKACIEKDELVKYQEERLGKLKTALSQERSDKAFEEMDSDNDFMFK
jgi:hypothetical protein